MQVRQFSSTPAPAARSIVSYLTHRHAAIPPYPYGISQCYKQSNLGLYGGKRIRFGNKVSERNEIKTRRTWRPNVQRKVLYSRYLGKSLQLRVTPRVLRTIEKEGGLDRYLTSDKKGRIKDIGMEGWYLRWRLMQTDGWKEHVEQERVRLGLKEPSKIKQGAEQEPQVGDVAWLKKEIEKYDRLLEAEGEVVLGDDSFEPDLQHSASGGIGDGHDTLPEQSSDQGESSVESAMDNLPLGNVEEAGTRPSLKGA